MRIERLRGYKKMKKKYFKIGEKIILEVVKNDGCNGCFFYDGISCDIIMFCSAAYRKDKTNVIFKQIKTEK